MTWKKVKLGDICLIEKGKVGIKKAISGKFPLVVIGDERKSHNEFHFDGQAVIIPLVSSSGHGRKDLKRIHYQEGKFAVGDILCAVMPKDYNETYAKFLYYFMDLNKEDELVSRMKGMANVSLPIKSLLDIEIPLPPISEQKAIVQKLENQRLTIEKINTELSHQLDIVKKLRHQILQDAVQGKLVNQNPDDEPASILLKKIKAEKARLIKDKKLKKDKPLSPIKAKEIPFEIPENWVWCRLNDICEAIIDCPHSTPKYLDFKTDYYGIDTNCINERGEIIKLRTLSKESYEERIRRLLPKENDIVYAREGSIGLATFMPANKNICLGQRVMLFRASKAISSRFLKHIVTEDTYKNRLLAKHRGIGAKHVNVRDIVESLLPLPPLPEQHRIVAKVESLMRLCDELEANIRQNQSYTEQLLQAALREALQ